MPKFALASIAAIGLGLPEEGIPPQKRPLQRAVVHTRAHTRNKPNMEYINMQTDNILAGWLSGADSVGGYDNPAGSLYTEGQATTMAAMTNPDIALMTNCSGCSASRPGLCC